ncbi:MAG: 2'-5' RNA ligase family protein [Polyangiales bacterium]
MDTARLFVGCLLDLAATRRCVDAARSLRRALDAAGPARVVGAAGQPPRHPALPRRHRRSGTAPALAAALADVARAHGPLKLAPRGLLALPSPDAPRVLALDLAEGHDALAALARAVDDACAELGFPREARPFRGHVTLARVKHHEGGLDALAPHLPQRLDASPAVASELTLWRSDLTRLGAEHRALARHPLGGARNPSPAGPRAHRGQDTST